MIRILADTPQGPEDYREVLEGYGNLKKIVNHLQDENRKLIEEMGIPEETPFHRQHEEQLVVCHQGGVFHIGCRSFKGKPGGQTGHPLYLQTSLQPILAKQKF